MKIIHVLDILTCTSTAYESKQGETGSDLKMFIHSKLNISPSDQLLLFAASGDVLDDNDCLERCHQQPDIIYLFNTSKKSKHSILPVLPDRVRELVGSAEEKRKYSDLKLYWGHSLYYCNKLALDYNQLLQGQRALMINIVKSKYLPLQMRRDALTRSSIKLETVIDMYKNLYECDFRNYQLLNEVQDDDGCISEWEDMSAEVHSFSDYINIKPLLAEIDKAQRNLLPLQKSPMIAEQLTQHDLDKL